MAIQFPRPPLPVPFGRKTPEKTPPPTRPVPPRAHLEALKAKRNEDVFEAARASAGNARPRPELPDAKELAENLRQTLTQARIREAGRNAVDALRTHQLRERLAEVLGGATPGATPPGTQAPATTTWNIAPGDTVGDISWNLMQQGVPGPVEAIANQIVELNGLTNPDLIIAGETLQVPAPPGTPTTNGTPPPGTNAPGTNGTPPPGGAPVQGEGYPVPYISQMSSQGGEDDWNASSNCGPTTLAMIAKGFGLGEGMSDGAFINQLANSIGMGAEGTGYDGIESMAAQLGLRTETNPGTDVGWIRSQLEAGNLVAVNGNRSVTAANEQPPFASGSAAGGHWIAVTGMTPEGNFIVKDPSTTCKELTPAELERFLAEHQYGGFAVAVQPPPGVSPTTGPSAPTGDVSAQAAQLESLRLAPGAMSLAETGFAGQGEHILAMAEKYDVPIDLAMAMLWKESQWGTTGQSAEHNNPGNLKFVGQPGAHEAFTSSGAYGSFAGWPTMEQGIEAYFQLLGTHYRSEIDSGDWGALVNRYAPPSENDTGLYIQQVTDYAATVRRHLGLE
ncbi:glucosaminidase domain-containing protein [Pyxidicoccus sp. 3LFB2]